MLWYDDNTVLLRLDLNKTLKLKPIEGLQLTTSKSLLDVIVKHLSAYSCFILNPEVVNTM